MHKVFCVGMPRTGTSSLTMAMRMLGYRCVRLPSPLEWSRVDDFDFIADMPVTSRYRDLAVRYPDSRFILTTRNAQRWVDSMSRWYDSTPLDDVPEWMHQYTEELFGTRRYDRHTFLQALYRHTQAVFDFFKDEKERLVVMDIVDCGDGWDELAQVVHVTIPDTIGDFPHMANRRLG